MDVGLLGTCAVNAVLTFVGVSLLMGRGSFAPRVGKGPPSGAVRAVEGLFLGMSKAMPLSGRGEKARRRLECLKEMPTLLDIVSLGLSAGLSFDASLELFCNHYDSPLSRAFGEAMLRWRMGLATREEALTDLALDLDLKVLERFARAVGEALSFGTPLADVLERQAQSMRDEQRAQVEEEIERVPVKMLIPLGTLIVPAMLLAILGPLLGSAMVIA